MNYVVRHSGNVNNAKQITTLIPGTSILDERGGRVLLVSGPVDFEILLRAQSDYSLIRTTTETKL